MTASAREEEENSFLSRAPRSPIIKKKNKATSVYRLFLQVKQPAKTAVAPRRQRRFAGLLGNVSGSEEQREMAEFAGELGVNKEIMIKNDDNEDIQEP